MLTMLAAVTMMTGASAQKTERLAHIVDGFYEKDSVVLDSMYYYWNDFVNLISCDVVRKETLNGIINDIKQEHCRTIEVWDYTKENESC